MPERLDETTIAAHLAELPTWTRQGEEIRREAKAPDFLTGATKIVPAIAQAAEAANHHPDIDIRWTNLTFALTTHDAGGLTELDFQLAHQIDEILDRHGAS